MTYATRNVINAVEDERKRQDDKWGQQNHNIFKWLTILGEEYGEACKDAFDANQPSADEQFYTPRIRKELIEVAAVAVAIVESIDRNGLKA